MGLGDETRLDNRDQKGIASRDARALGRRINETRGVTRANHQGIALFMEYNQEDGEYSYRLDPKFGPC